MSEEKKPIVEVIADYPNNTRFEIGQRIEFNKKGRLPLMDSEEDWITDFIEVKSEGSYIYQLNYFAAYPHLFKITWK